MSEVEQRILLNQMVIMFSMQKLLTSFKMLNVDSAIPESLTKAINATNELFEN